MDKSQLQAELLEQYIQDLLRSEDALPPCGLEAETALFAQTLVAARQADRPDSDAKDRVWNQVLFTMHVIPEEMPSSILRPEPTLWRKAAAAQSNNDRRTRRKHLAVTLVATLFVVVFFSSLLIYSILPQINDLRGDAASTPSSQVVPSNVRLDPGDSLLLRTASLFEISAVTGAGGNGDTAIGGRANVAD